mmetsp:Transcript_32424/g.69444  ORF Transcript_32424/g.69444 Transcript_32424/m.69444 type:complete len:200 (+) Transcript_32424:1466-2065(+)
MPFSQLLHQSGSYIHTFPIFHISSHSPHVTNLLPSCRIPRLPSTHSMKNLSPCVVKSLPHFSVELNCLQPPLWRAGARAGELRLKQAACRVPAAIVFHKIHTPRCEGGCIQLLVIHAPRKACASTVSTICVNTKFEAILVNKFRDCCDSIGKSLGIGLQATIWISCVLAPAVVDHNVLVAQLIEFELLQLGHDLPYALV